MEPLLVHTARGYAIKGIMIALFGAAICGLIAWLLADPNFAGVQRGLLDEVPVAVRLVFFGMLGLACLYAAGLGLQAAWRSTPSFVIAPDGVTDLRKRPPLHFGWHEIGAVRADRKWLFLNRRGNRGRFGRNRIAIPLRSVAPDRDSILHAIASHLPQARGL